MRILSEFDPQGFVQKQIAEIKKTLGKERALVAISGGVDSTTSAVLVHKAIGENLTCAILDDAFMREGEPKLVAQILSQPPLSLPMKVVDVQERFLKAMDGLQDAEEKRKMFRETFYKVLAEKAETEKCRFLVQGTILADIIETAGRVKTQHNVLAQIGIDPVERFGFQVVEPLKALLKWQVREVARHLQIPSQISERQPFPGPGLSVRVVGKISVDKLETLKRANTITEKSLAPHHPDQYFATILDNVEKPQLSSYSSIKETVAKFCNVSPKQTFVKILQDKATGMRANKRVYGDIAIVKVLGADGQTLKPSIKSLIELQEKVLTQNPTLTRCLYAIEERAQEQPYMISVRAVQTKDYLTADVAEIPWTTLSENARKVLESCKNLSGVYYDVTPKPPATIEME